MELGVGGGASNPYSSSCRGYQLPWLRCFKFRLSPPEMNTQDKHNHSLQEALGERKVCMVTRRCVPAIFHSVYM